MLRGQAALDVEVEVPVGQHNHTLTELTPGTEYVCTLRASTRKGYGDAVRKIFWTKPLGKDPEEWNIMLYVVFVIKVSQVAKTLIWMDIDYSSIWWEKVLDWYVIKVDRPLI